MREYFPDGTEISEWFYENTVPTLEKMGPTYNIKDFHIIDDGKIYTKEFQHLIDMIHSKGGGVIVVPEGTYMIGSVFFKQDVHLYIAKGGCLKGSDDINDYQLLQTRIEGESCMYFAALINVDSVDGFVMFGEGVIDGNGMRSWKAFALRRQWNPACTNKDEQRPRLIYISNSSNIIVYGLKMQNSHFWTNHLYRCNHVKYLNCSIFSPAKPIKAPSTDAIDIDVCSDILIKNCYMEVNDDSTVLKGGKGPWADQQPENGSNERIIIEDCRYGFCHGILTCGSESIHNKNILVRRIQVKDAMNFIWLKMRPDTPQKYEYLTIQDVKIENVNSFLCIHPWTQFYDLKDRKDIPLSYAEHIKIENCDCDCNIFFDVEKDEKQYLLSNFELSEIKIRTKQSNFDETMINHMKTNNVIIEEVESDEMIVSKSMPD